MNIRARRTSIDISTWPVFAADTVLVSSVVEAHLVGPDARRPITSQRRTTRMPAAFGGLVSRGAAAGHRS
ncbi:hypothetical protein [Umezawaea sp. Da 62-37]|uniref:hypothetical protein n=1 Tax=Umezawaea sp. Da 62-37 TaxID=3075927 RepID=UPI0028F6DA2F|nr:hypothetical protein [Umezawaea sp. Da 62-37]WNV88919.1 hypothetical protein RM788_11635 [Umezawaea sp. Da 62-37]